MLLRKSLLASFIIASPYIGFADQSSSSSEPSEASSESSVSSSDESPVIPPQINPDSLAELRETCKQHRAPGSQIKEFKIRVECGGSYTFWQQQEGRYTLSNSAETIAKTNTKYGRFSTEEFVIDYPIGDSQGQCFNQKRMRMSGPEGFGIGVEISDCDDLIPENLKTVCQDELEEYCENNFVTAEEKRAIQDAISSSSSSSSSSSANQRVDLEGTCVLSNEKIYDACTLR